MPAAARIRAAFDEAGVTGYAHAVDIDSGSGSESGSGSGSGSASGSRPTQICVGADTPVTTASVHKLCLLVTLYRQAADGLLDLTEQVESRGDARTGGPTGLAAMLDPVRMSLRDLAYLMMSVSDNAAADVLFHRVGLDAVNEAMAALGLTHTLATHTMGELFATLAEDTGQSGVQALADPRVVARLRALDPSRTNRSTPRDMTRLLTAVWRDRACPPEYGAAVRRILGLQVWPHRLASGFPFDDVHVCGKTGSLPTVRNEIGVVEYPDGGRYAVAVFTRAASTAATLPAADAVIGTAARIAVDALRAP